MHVKQLPHIAGALLFICCIAAPVMAQRGSPTNLSDVTGPFLGNTTVQAPYGTGGISRFGSTWVMLPGLMAPGTGAVSPSTDSAASSALLNSAIEFNGAMDKLLPFCGCSNPRWRQFNHTVKTAAHLRHALTDAITEQKKILAAQPTPEQLATAQNRLKALEDTTSSLEKATEVLTALSNALDKAR
jgi:hypothetical protein